MTRMISFVAAVVLLTMPASAQITVTSSDLNTMFAGGTSWFEYRTDQSGLTMDVGSSSGSNAQTWTLPSFTPTDSSRVDNVQPAATPYLSTFPAAAFAQRAAMTDGDFAIDFFQYFSLSNDSLYTIGRVQHYTGMIGSTPVDTVIFMPTMEFNAHVPVQLGSTHTGPADTTDLGGGYTQIESETETYDAFGTLNLSFGSFQALRSRTVKTTNVYNGTTLINSYSSYSYNWLTKEGHRVGVDADTGGASGSVAISGISVTRVGTTPVTSVGSSGSLLTEFSLDQNFPNPFNPSTMIGFALQRSGPVVLTVYDLLGREVARLVDGVMSAGRHAVSFDAGRLAGGMYLYRLQAGLKSETRRMVLVK